MSPQELYDIWAPPDSVWSLWAKPALFASAGGSLNAPARPDDEVAADMSWLPDDHERAALVIDLPGPSSARVGLALAQRGYRPVPLFNTTRGFNALINVEPIAEALACGATILPRLSIPPDAAPAFLIDSDRLAGRGHPDPGVYDNRWLVFPQDFPSAGFLARQSISVAMLVTTASRPADDLAHVLLRWQQAGLSIWRVNPAEPGTAEQVTVSRPPLYRSVWHRALALLRLRRNSAGGFGSTIPLPQSRVGGYGGFA